MNTRASRRNFLAAGLSLPAAAAVPGPADTAAPRIEYRTLGKTGLKVSSLGFGCMLASDPVVLERAVELGINYFDTARAYQGGNNERMVGAALKGHRDQVVLATKSTARTKADMLRDLETSLRELGTDHVDIWFIHNRNTPEEVAGELFEAHELARSQGKIRFRGLSYHFNMPRMLEYTLQQGCIDVALASYNFMVGDEVGDAIRRARAQGLGIVGMKVMAGGYARIQKGDRLYGQEPNQLSARLKKPGAMLAALKYVLRNRSVDTAIIGITDFDELDEDLRAMSEPFTAEDGALLALESERIGPLYCRACGACSGTCAQGVRVADTLRHLMYADGYGQFAMARQAWLDQPEDARSVRCADCRECSVRCPNGVHVQANLIRAQRLFA